MESESQHIASHNRVMPMIGLSENKVFALPGGAVLPLVQIPTGYFRLGEENASITLGDYLIGLNPITVNQYQCFIEAGGYKNAQYWSKHGWTWREMNGVESPNTSMLSETFLGKNNPQVGVSWYEANAFCNWLSQATGSIISLPSEVEWEKAARGRDSRKYPWGDIPPTDIHCNFDNGKGHTTEVGIYPAGRSPYGCFDMGGNVWEWCKNTEGPLPYKNISDREDPETRSLVTMRGGSYLSPRNELLTWHRGFNYPIVRLNILGFRIVLKIKA